MEDNLIEELNALVNDISIYKTRISGLIVCFTSLNPFVIINNIKRIASEEPWKIRFILRLIPIEVVVNTNVEEISEAALKLAERINENESYKIDIEKRFSTIDRMEIIDSIAKHINRKVNLEDPDRIILIEIIGKEAGISLIKKDDIFSQVKSKRSID
jgi:tRNA acetyltransferase TAN1